MSPRRPTDRFQIMPSDVHGRPRPARPPEWLAPMLATLSDRRFSDPDWLFERKLDGERCLAFGRDGAILLKSRNGNDASGAYLEPVAAFNELRTADMFVAAREIVRERPSG